jgi:hypothetical protein
MALLWQNYMTKMHVMILVNEATSWLFLLLNETTTFKASSCSLVSQIIYDLAVILGGGMNGFA